MAFIDEAWIEVSSGPGGDGAVSFQREKFRPKGGPDGGRGGRGGSVVIQAAVQEGSLAWLKRHPHQRADPGGRGGPANKTGGDASDLVVQVPQGTVIRDSSETILSDLAAPGDRFVAAKGGRGGRGNAAFKGPNRRAPRFREKGEPGVEARLHLELKLLADVAVIGPPNAGKSTLVSRVSGAKPKIDSYPFTTLEPSLGVVEAPDGRFSICDIPGLIEGAHQGKGLGLKFLRHAERAPILVCLVDASTGEDPLGDYEMILKELLEYRADLDERPKLVVLNKSDLVSIDEINEQAAKFGSRGVDVITISAKDGAGIDPLIDELWSMVSEARESATSEGYQLFRTKQDATTVTREGNSWRVKGDQVEKWVAMTELANDEAVAYLQNRFERSGLDRLLRDAGVVAGDEVLIGDAVMEWNP